VKETINPPSLWDARSRGYNHVVKFTDPKAMIFVAGMAAAGKDLKLAGVGDIEVQTRATFENIRIELEAAGATLKDIVDMTVYLVDIKNHQWPVRKVRDEYFAPEDLPVSTMIQVAAFALEEMLIEIDVIAVV
jgi:enamine deaminase RidA (YjgF/YER057c/UK114 family)